MDNSCGTICGLLVLKYYYHSSKSDVKLFYQITANIGHSLSFVQWGKSAKARTKCHILIIWVWIRTLFFAKFVQK